MGFFDNLSSAQAGVRQASVDETNRLAAIAAAEQAASNSVMQRGQQALQNQRLAAGLALPSVNGSTYAQAVTPQFQPIGGTAPQTTIQPMRTNPQVIKGGGYNLPLYSAAPVPAAPANAPATPAAPTAGVTPPATTKSEWQTSVQDPAALNRELTNIRNNMINSADPTRFGDVINYFTGTPEKGAALKEFKDAAAWVTTPAAVDFFSKNRDKIAEFTANPVEFYRAYKGQVSTSAASTAQTPAQATGYETAVTPTPTTGVAGVTPPASAAPAADTANFNGNAQAGVTEDKIDPSLPPEFQSRNARMKMTPAENEWRTQRLIADRERTTQALNQNIAAVQQAAQQNAAIRNQRYSYILQQAQVASSSGNTGYAEQLISQADAILQEAADENQSITKTVMDMRQQADDAYRQNDMELWVHQGTLAEQEWQAGNPSRMVSILEAFGKPTDIEDAGNGKFRIRHPAENGGYVYEKDDNGKLLELSRSGVSDYMMGTISEEYSKAKAAAEAAQRAKLDETNYAALVEINKALALAELDPKKYYEPSTDDQTGAKTYMPKDPNSGNPVVVLTPVKQANGITTYQTQKYNPNE